jgi:hypothetical protein
VMKSGILKKWEEINKVQPIEKPVSGQKIDKEKGELEQEIDKETEMTEKEEKSDEDKEEEKFEKKQKRQQKNVESWDKVIVTSKL